MDLTTWEGLKAAIADYLGRDDLAERIPHFIRLAELRMQREVRTRVMERTAVTALPAGTATVKLPNRRVEGDWKVFLEMRDLVWAAGNGLVSNLHFIPPDEYRLRARESGVPKLYTIIGEKLHVAPVPAADGELRIAYYGEIEPLGPEQVNNPMLITAPDLYLYAALLESIPFTRASGAQKTWQDFYNEAKGRLQANEERGRFTSNLSMRAVRRI